MKVSSLSTFLVAFSSLAASTPVAGPQNASPKPKRINPDRLFPIEQSHPDHIYNTKIGLVKWEDGLRVNTLVSIQIDGGFGGKTCRLSFKNQRAADGATTVDVYSVTGVDKSNTWNSRPIRGQHWCSFDVVPARDQIAINWKPGHPTFPCPSKRSRLEFELTASKDEYMHLYWERGSGLYLEIL